MVLPLFFTYIAVLFIFLVTLIEYECKDVEKNTDIENNCYLKKRKETRNIEFHKRFVGYGL